jgi:hypothetical protein
MSKEEQEEATNNAVKELEEHREMKSFSSCNVPIHVFHNAHATIESIEREVRIIPSHV